jgi:hypothetical protein
MSQYSNLPAASRAAVAVWRAAPIAAGAVAILSLASCAGVVGYVPAADGQAPTPVDASGSLEAGADSGGPDQPDAGVSVDAAGDTAVALSDAGGGPVDGGYAEEGYPTDSPPEAPFPAACLPTPNTDTLPFAVDNAYATSGYEGDAVNAQAIALDGDTTCGGNRSGLNPLGNCHTVLYAPLVQGQTIGAGGTAQGWAGVAWQYPADNWGTGPGYAIPPGAKTVTFAARGAAGGEVVSFWIGGTGDGTAERVLCSDPLSVHVDVTLTSKWTRHAIPLSGPYAPAVLTGFGFTVATSQQPSVLQGQAITFYVDDIRWQM